MKSESRNETAVSDTPRTDELHYEPIGQWNDWNIQALLNLSRSLERELAQKERLADHFRQEMEEARRDVTRAEKEAAHWEAQYDRVVKEGPDPTFDAVLQPITDKMAEIHSRAIPSETAPTGWIACKDKMPDEYVNGEYLCWFQERQAILFYDCQIGWMWGDGSPMGSKQAAEVTYWRDLPNAPFAAPTETGDKA